MSGNEKPRAVSQHRQGYKETNANTQYHELKRLASTACRSSSQKTDLHTVRKEGLTALTSRGGNYSKRGGRASLRVGGAG